MSSSSGKNSEFPSPSSKKSREELDDLRNLLDELDRIKRVLRSESSNQDELINQAISHLSRLLIVRCCGYLEFLLSEASRVCSERDAYKLVGYINYLERSRRGVKADIDRIITTLKHLSSSPIGSFEDELNSEKSNIKSMISMRNLISHGENEGSTKSKAIDYYDSTIRVSEIIESALGASSNGK
jgi:hypothetical protein